MRRRSGQKEKHLSEEDRILWHRVARSTRPLHGSASVQAMMPEQDDAQAPSFDVTKAASQLTEKFANPADKGAAHKQRMPQPSIDRIQKRKLAKGRLPIEARIDLHGLIQAEAHDQLLAFLSAAVARGRRHVLVITGKGSSPQSQGVLARMVPQWLSTPPFRTLVSAHEPAARHHGGSGALYVRLRRR
ncbi:Smr/MutS family protein [Notoacmeibacter ruber]|uniref:DNA mismatch repair protein MutS n=1 Tax=Notoacmeibacter ruber TaxID=2670375 RepID=A0A3L7JEF8_9HYPH|nr:Smr/MutS family protein [Notoacmeibacter ruber]RLQ89157.1 DNA mismatch repair protein MutS [Notoacmeibacter ruber]